MDALPLAAVHAEGSELILHQRVGYALLIQRLRKGVHIALGAVDHQSVFIEEIVLKLIGGGVVHRQLHRQADHQKRYAAHHAHDGRHHAPLVAEQVFDDGAGVEAQPLVAAPLFKAVRAGGGGQLPAQQRGRREADQPLAGRVAGKQEHDQTDRRAQKPAGPGKGQRNRPDEEGGDEDIQHQVLHHHHGDSPAQHRAQQGAQRVVAHVVRQDLAGGKAQRLLRADEGDLLVDHAGDGRKAYHAGHQQEHRRHRQAQAVERVHHVSDAADVAHIASAGENPVLLFQRRGVRLGLGKGRFGVRQLRFRVGHLRFGLLKTRLAVGQLGAGGLQLLPGGGERRFVSLIRLDGRAQRRARLTKRLQLRKGRGEIRVQPQGAKLPGNLPARVLQGRLPVGKRLLAVGDFLLAVGDGGLVVGNLGLRVQDLPLRGVDVGLRVRELRCGLVA